MIDQAIRKLLNGQNLHADLATAAMTDIMTGKVDEVKIATFLTALRIKGETSEEITAFARILRNRALKVPTDSDVLDIVGTGGDNTNTFNISTTTALVAAACGVRVAKHGNRSVSSKSGSADVLEALGVNINLAEDAHKVLMNTGITFMFAPLFHSSMKHVASARKKMGIRTVFNILGPLINPAFASFQVMGVYDEKLVVPLAEVLNNLGIKRALVIHGKDGLDEATLTDLTYVCEIKNNNLTSYYLDPRDFGFNFCEMADLVGGDATENAQITRDILAGIERGPKRDVVILNTALALYVALDISISAGVELATAAIDNGQAIEKLNELIKMSNGRV
ncbi:anthranilate phosphoribosyltransferase [Candidatus Epulonipiscium viviparus]|uniref:anthranilate phosphoribosyltransferase n=1 Tax=Candidatus Epulonipiscium viviparus TaxID=420336 RepID=UPI0027380606|nr:anthranilate phosphoribosyltransferase [Candidatus Epulopiscium viviparus]